jgi:steroid 5-alpha reductase family enzyme
MSELLLGSFVWIMLLMLGLWVVSVRLSDVSIVDVFWGGGC